MKAIYLTGFMGSGKTTIGKALSEELAMDVIDTDTYIEGIAGKQIKAIFAEDGENVFRQYEKEILRMLPTKEVIITTGGGMVIQRENREWMLNNGYVVYLSCSLDTLVGRINQDENRPLAKQDESKMKVLFGSRQSFYEEAHVAIETTNKTVAKVVAELKEWLQENRDILEV